VAADVLNTVEQLIVRVLDQLGGRRLVHLAITGTSGKGWENRWMVWQFYTSIKLKYWASQVFR